MDTKPTMTSTKKEIPEVYNELLKKKEAERNRHSMQEWEKEQKKEQCWKKR